MCHVQTVCTVLVILSASHAVAGEKASPEELEAIAKLKRTGFRISPDDKKKPNQPARIVSHENLKSRELLTPIGQLKSVEELWLKYGTYHDDALEMIKDIATLKGIRLEFNRNVQDAGLAHLAKLDKLERLSLTHVGVTDAGMKHLAKLKSLTSLGLQGAKVTGAGLAELKPLKLKMLNLDGATIDDDALKAIGAMHDLESLALGFTKITDQGLEHLAGLSKLKFLRFNDTKLTGVGLKHLKNAPLRELHLYDAQINDEGLRSLADLKAAKFDYLNLNGNKGITDRGIDAFEGLRIQSLELGRTSITKEGQERVKMMRGIRFPRF